MVVYCWVKGCKNRGDKKVKRSFHYIPKVRTTEGEQTLRLSIERRRVWLTNIRRKDQPSSTSRICSDHFISGKPADLYDRSNPDWAPTLKLTKEATLEEIEFRRRLSEANLKRYQRAKYRSRKKNKINAATALLDHHYAQGANFTASPLPGSASKLPSPTSDVHFVKTWIVIPQERIVASNDDCVMGEVVKSRAETINQSDDDDDDDDSIIEVIID
ncbi:uncharacterized protein LOC106953726 [Poecilia latipinna]|uniref:uncharacterized protein LOC106953726 n=1 Tax=Poecilia latipinna TaxID=48699 RepID=UPI00072E1817|nr:PREDICTED: uncharacterized protein LOC106953726 [Poecilia latipinna]